MTPEDIEKRLLYRDGLMLVIDKPAGIPVHKGPKGGENMEQYFQHLRFGLPRDPALAHRLDKDTSGCLVLGRHRKALQKLGKLFEQGKVEKIYWAVVKGEMSQREGRITLPLAKASPDPRSWKMTVAEQGQEAVTDYRVLGQGDGISWLELKPRTGRTHQLRVHCAAMGCPMVGDVVYGAPDAAQMLHLHAQGVSVPLYPKKEAVSVQAHPPEHMLGLLRACGYSEAPAQPKIPSPLQGEGL